MIVGWDVSTTAIGICVKDDDGSTVEFGVIYPVGTTHSEKHRNAAAQVVNFCKRVCPSGTHVVEQHLGGFSGGFSSAQTKMALASMNAVISYVLGDYGTVMHILPVTTKRIMGLTKLEGEDKKDAVVRLARSADPNFPYRETPKGNWVKGTDDMADAWLLAEAGAKVLRGEASIGPAAKTKRHKGEARRAKDRGKTEG